MLVIETVLLCLLISSSFSALGRLCLWLFSFLGNFIHILECFSVQFAVSSESAIEYSESLGIVEHTERWLNLMVLIKLYMLFCIFGVHLCSEDPFR